MIGETIWHYRIVVLQGRRHRPRAYAMQGDTAKAKAASQDFILWKDADPDIPILLAAKAEYAKLQ